MREKNTMIIFVQNANYNYKIIKKNTLIICNGKIRNKEKKD